MLLGRTQDLKGEQEQRRDAILGLPSRYHGIQSGEESTLFLISGNGVEFLSHGGSLMRRFRLS
jgi:hypothetical protein